MPPAVETSDEESEGSVIDFRKPKQAEEDIEDEDEEGDGGDEDGNEQEGVYVVEALLAHQYIGGTLHFMVKWKGYDNPGDNTWEPEINVLEGAEDLVQSYFNRIGGRPEKSTKGKKKKRPISQNGTPESSQSKKKSKRQSNLKSELDLSTPELGTPVTFDKPDWVPDNNEWEKEVKAIDTIEREGKSGTLFVYLHWRNGYRSKVDITQCYEKCPQAMLRFYESHLVFKTSD